MFNFFQKGFENNFNWMLPYQQTIYFPVAIYLYGFRGERMFTHVNIIFMGAPKIWPNC